MLAVQEYAMAVPELPLGEVRVSHPALLVAVHAAAGEMVKDELPAVGGTVAADGVSAPAPCAAIPLARISRKAKMPRATGRTTVPFLITVPDFGR
jgi:hypothetical protein